MALFSSDSKKKAPAKQVQALYNEDGRLARALKAPWFSEKALIGTERGVYVFEVPRDATKPEIAAAVESYFNVTPVKVRVANLPAKKVSLRSRRGQGFRAARHKAYVYLKKGDSIVFG
jgi:large subunit ribosomal protein L23